jgi:epoxyqueuosine reductase
MKKLKNFIQEEISGNITGRFFVDSAPVSERSLAVRAGLGWQGKNTNLIHPRMGSYVFIGEIILNVELIPGNLMNEACGTCTRCIDACPTGALVDSYQLDSNKCISYLTIENKGDISAELSPKYDEWFFGCDICQEVCPWNKNAPPHHESDFNLRHEFRDMTREQWLAIDKTDFDEISKGSPIRRAGYEGLIRNLKAALKTE